MLSVALVMTAMMLVNAMSASAAGEAKGQDNTNPGYRKDSVGDRANNVCEQPMPTSAAKGLPSDFERFDCSLFNEVTGKSIGVSNN